jgi:hypothetical protein
VIDHEPDRERQQTRAEGRDKEKAYRSIWRRLQDVRALELYRDKLAFKQTGITHPARLYGRKPEDIAPAFDFAMQRIWDLGTIDATGRADTELRRTYHLIAKGRAPVTEADVIALGQIPEAQLRLMLPWLSLQVGVLEAQDHVDEGEAPPVITEEES